MPRPEISYTLPVSCLEVCGTITETQDTILNERTATPVTTVALHTHGIDRDQVLQILTGGLRDTSLSLQLTDDGLLTSADAESTGQLGKVVIGVIGAGAALASVVAGLPPLSAVVPGVAGFQGRSFGIASVQVQDEREEGETPEQKIAVAYAKRYPEMSALRTRYAVLVDAAMERIAALAGGMLAVGAVGWTAAAEVHQQREVLSVLRAELERLDAHFASWRAGTITTHVTKRQRCFTLDVLRGAGVRVTGTGVTFAPEADGSVRFAWNTLGVAITMEPAGKPRRVQRDTRPNAVIVRLPRRIQLGVYGNVDGQPVLREERPYLVVDSACETQVVQFRRSLWARRSTKLGFSDLGVLRNYSVGSTSSAAALADAAGQLPQTVSSNLDEVAKIDKELTALGKANGAPAPNAATVKRDG